VIVLFLIVAGGTGLVIAGIVQGDPVTAVFGGVLLAFILWGMTGGRSGGDADSGDAGDGDA
jgi:hypothetical protein